MTAVPASSSQRHSRHREYRRRRRRRRRRSKCTNDKVELDAPPILLRSVARSSKQRLIFASTSEVRILGHARCRCHYAEERPVGRDVSRLCCGAGVNRSKGDVKANTSISFSYKRLKSDCGVVSSVPPNALNLQGSFGLSAWC